MINRAVNTEKGAIHTLPLLLIVVAVGLISYLLIASTAPFRGGVFEAVNNKPASFAASLPVDTYTTNFLATENPISEGGVWLNGAKDGIDWTDVETVAGKVFGDPSVNSPPYKDPSAVLKGTFGPNQQAQATVICNNPNPSYYQEVELRLRAAITPHSITGYEILFRCLQGTATYMGIVRWNGPLGDWTSIGPAQAGVGVKTGDVVKATIIGNVITAYINGVQVDQVGDGIFTSGNPGVGFNYGVGTTNTDFGFTNYTAQTLAGFPTPPPSGIESPFNGPHNLPGILQVEDYDYGGEGVAYHDSDTTNSGSQYRNDGVDITSTQDAGGGSVIGWTATGEWLKYTVNATNSGGLILQERVASQGTGGNFHIEVDGTNVTGTISVPNTGGWDTFTSLTQTTSSGITQGAHIVRLVMDSNGSTGYVGNFNWLELNTPIIDPTPHPTSTPTPVSTPTPSPTPSPCPKASLGDSDCNGAINIFDFNTLVTNFGKTGVGLSGGDFDGNGKVDIFDFNTLVTNFGH